MKPTIGALCARYQGAMKNGTVVQRKDGEVGQRCPWLARQLSYRYAAFESRPVPPRYNTRAKRKSISNFIGETT